MRVKRDLLKSPRHQPKRHTSEPVPALLLSLDILLCYCPAPDYLLKMTEAQGGMGRGRPLPLSFRVTGARNPPRGPNPSMAPCTSSGRINTEVMEVEKRRTGQVGFTLALPGPRRPPQAVLRGFLMVAPLVAEHGLRSCSCWASSWGSWT